MIRPRRSLLFMPGSNARALEKARTLPADGVILDLEDSVAPDAKAAARDQIAEAIAAKGFGKREVLIRVNALDSPWWIDDVTMAAQGAARRHPGAEDFQRRGSQHHRRSPERHQRRHVDPGLGDDRDRRARCCMPNNSRRRRTMRNAARRLRVRAQRHRARDADADAAGPRRDAADDHALHPRGARARARNSRRPLQRFRNVDGFAAECAQGRDLGFDGKTLIHPGQIEACNAIFTPPAEEVAQARKIIAAFELPENAARGAIQLDGQMVERLHADMAKRTIAIADAIAAMAH